MRYDQRVLVLVEVRGEQRDWDEAERVFDQRGWPVVTAFARGEGPSRSVLRESGSARLYSVEVRFFGARNRRTELATAWRVEKLARVAGLEMYARRCGLVDRPRERLTGWRVHTVDHRPPRAPAPGPLTRTARLRRAVAVSRAHFGEVLLSRHRNGGHGYGIGSPSALPDEPARRLRSRGCHRCTAVLRPGAKPHRSAPRGGRVAPYVPHSGLAARDGLLRGGRPAAQRCADMGVSRRRGAVLRRGSPGSSWPVRGRRPCGESPRVRCAVRVYSVDGGGGVWVGCAGLGSGGGGGLPYGCGPRDGATFVLRDGTGVDMRRADG